LKHIEDLAPEIRNLYDHYNHTFIQDARGGLALMQNLCHNQALNAGWHDTPRDKGTMFMLMVSEIAEAMEGARKELMDDHLEWRKMEEVELADTIIRILDYAGKHNMDLAGAVIEKLCYNAQRADHKREARAAEGGKKF